MHDLPTQTKNLVSCLTSKVRSDNPHLKRPTIDVEFDMIHAKNSSGVMTLHLVARDQRTKSYIYMAETGKDANEWVAKQSEFYGRIYLFVRHILELLSEENTVLSLSEKGRILVEIAKCEFQKIMRS